MLSFFEQSPVSTGVDPSHSQVNGHSCEAKSDAKKQHLLLLSEMWGWSGEEALSSVNKEIAIQLAKNPQLQISCLVAYTNEGLQGEAKKLGVQLVGAKYYNGYTPLQCLSFPPDFDVGVDCIISCGMVVGTHARPLRDYHHSNSKWVHIAQSSSENENSDEIELYQNADVAFAIGDHVAEDCERRLGRCEKTVDAITPGIFSEFQECKQVAKERETFCVITWHPSGRLVDETWYDILAMLVGMFPRNKYRLIYVVPLDRTEEIKKTLLQHESSCRQFIVRSLPQSFQTLRRWFVEADLLIMPLPPSCDEEFGLIALQAISANLPVLVSNNTGLAKALRGVPFGHLSIVTSDKPEEWKRRIEEVKQKERTQRLDEASQIRESYQNKYPWKKQGDMMLSKISACILQSNPSGSHHREADSQ